MNANKKPWVAFVLSFFVPGAGLWYLDKWLAGWINLAAVTLVLMLLLVLPLGREVFDYFHYVVLMLMAGSGGVAHACAESRSTHGIVSVNR
jgi:hypothetical protein